MKYILTLSIIFLGLNIYGQTLRTSSNTTNGVVRTDSLWFTHSEYVNHVFGSLNMSEVTTNFFLQRSLSYFDPNAFDGKNGNDSTIRSSSQALANYSTFYYSALDTSASYAPRHPKYIIADIKGYLSTNQIPISLVNHAYHVGKLNALLDGLYTTNVDSTVLYDNPNRTVSPYEKRRLFMSSANVFGKTFSSNGDVTFNILPSPLHFTDTLSGSIEIDFGDGLGYVSVIANSSKTVYYSSSGTKLIKLKQGGLESSSEFHFIKNETYFNLKPYTSDLLMRGGNSSVAIGEQALGCDQVLDKPILVVEGFDLMGESDFNPFASEEILRALNRNGNVVTQLINLGYDFIVVRFSKNDASILENAAALKVLIDNINSSKVGSEKLTIIGLSMGGLVTKYCLKDMEDNSQIHNVENFFSFDSPHLGAYVPLGLQHLLRDASFALSQVAQDPMVNTALGKLGSEAAKEMLLYNMNDQSATIRTAFASSYASKGYPALTNNYGIANGRGDGVGLGYSSAAQLIDFKFRSIAGLVRHTQELFALPTGISTISYLKNRGIVAFLGLGGLTRYASRVRFDAEIVQETVPGSVIFAHRVYADALAEQFARLDIGPIPYNNYNGRNFTSFVPTVSALDLNNQNYAANGFYLPRNPTYNIAANHTTVLSSQITPFDDIIYASGGFSEHLEGATAIGNFIFEKIYGTAPPSDCGNICSFTPDFSGLTTICNSSPFVDISIANMPSGVVITWNLPNGVSLVSGQGTNSVRIASLADGVYSGGYVTVGRPGCTSTNFPFTLTFGRPSAIVGPVPLCATGGTYTIPFLPSDATVTWEVVGGGATIASSNNLQAQLLVAGQGLPTTLKATISSPTCGNIVLETSELSAGDLPYNFVEHEIYSDGMGPYVLCGNANNSNDYTNVFTYSLDAVPAYPLTMTIKVYDNNTFQIVHNESFITSTQSGYHILPDNLPLGTYYYQIILTGGDCGLRAFENAEGLFDVVNCGIGARVLISPNPASTELNVIIPKITSKKTREGKDQTPTKSFKTYIKLFDIRGKIIRQIDYDGVSEKVTIDVAGLPNGNYFIHLEEGKAVTKKQVVIRH